MAASGSMWLGNLVKMSRFSQSVVSRYVTRCYKVRHLATMATDEIPTNSAKQEKEVNVEQNIGEKQLSEQKEKFETELKELKDKYMRSLAETENVRTRMKKQIDDAKQFGIQNFCKDLLDVADVLNHAVDSVPKEEITKKNPHLKSLFEGLIMTESQLQKTFIKHGLQQIIPNKGDKFDPYFHEALFTVPSEEKDSGTIAVLQKIGYTLHDRTLRPALVGVFKS
ncbi:grpE protein homolog 1, mitochondrial-like [Gigantopelta aegis]|uniref:grpE protein homolog 1, mitochondrial-like n=1 Tax=Gigantopelta aegis TaxID=1735272 RepID=UPI001B88B459|nr:grpE protein homolog 1, mitochondrial-like [Gigantopelta aegis]